MNANHPIRGLRRRASQHRGVVLIFALIALIVMLIASYALVRSFNTTLFTAGNISFKRDMQNQAERAVPVVLNAMRAMGTLVTPESRANNLVTQNYSAIILAANAQGIPQILLGTTTAFDGLWTAGPILVPDQGVEIRYIVDRLCDAAGLDTVLGSARCQIVDNGPMGGSGSHLNVAEDSSSAGAGATSLSIVYRLSIRVDGPRDTQAFFQTTFTL
jgi:type IV pilus assembly protein PilX